MPEIQMGQVESRFADIIWAREPITAAELARIAERELGWKKTTSYTVLKRLCAKGIFKNEGGTVTSLLSREGFRAVQSRQFVEGAFGGSLPAFVAAFTSGRGLTERERAELRALIDGDGEVRAGVEQLFVTLLNRSLTASPLLLAVMALRLVLGRVPKRVMRAVWGLAALRLILPGLPSDVSVFGFLGPLAVEDRDMAFFTCRGLGVSPQLVLNLRGLQEGFALTAHGVVEAAPRNPDVYLPFAAQVWAFGAAMAGGWAVWSLVVLKRRLRTAVSLGDGVWECDDIRSPFLLGLVRPRIYLPSGLEPERAELVLAHEKAHIRGRDNWWKLLGLLLVTVHWFNPLVWAAYCLFCRDLELACDQAVIRDLDEPGRRSYAQALLSCAEGRRRVLVHPVAFGETGVKARLRGVLRYKKPARWALALSVVLSAAVLMGFATVPAGGWTLGARRVIGESNLYTREEISAAMDEAEAVFSREFSGCVLRELRYAGDDRAGDQMVLTSDFLVYAGDGSLTPGETYRNWLWFLERTGPGDWEIVGWGYG